MSLSSTLRAGGRLVRTILFSIALLRVLRHARDVRLHALHDVSRRHIGFGRTLVSRARRARVRSTEL